jgi:FlaA1/EpsC-like NDP-sugar epimerase
MGTPIKIAEMAKDLIRLSGFEPDVDIAVEFIGLRPGEKLYEELITEGEGIIPTGHEKIMVLKGNGFDKSDIETRIAELDDIVGDRNPDRIRAKLKEIVPEYVPASI